jgi:hypothetical protein
MDDLCGGELCHHGWRNVWILSDRGMDKHHAPIPSLLATSGVIITWCAKARGESHAHSGNG